MLYRICTERTNERDIATIVGLYFSGFTLLHGKGYFQSQAERSLVVEVETNEQDKVFLVASHIKRHNRQKAVMVQRIRNHAWIV